MSFQQFSKVDFKTVRWQPDTLTESYWISKLIGVFVKNGMRQRSENMIMNIIKRFKDDLKPSTFYEFFINLALQLRPVLGIVKMTPKGDKKGRKSKKRPKQYQTQAIKTARGIKIVLRWILDKVNQRSFRELEERVYNTFELLADPMRRKNLLPARHQYYVNLHTTIRRLPDKRPRQ